MRAPRRWRILAAVILIAAVLGYVAAPYVRAASLFIRVAHVGGRIEAIANNQAHAVTIMSPHTVPTRHGPVPAQFYRPDGRFTRTALLIPGIHSMGIKEPRLTALAHDMAGSGVMVMTLALPDLQRYKITPDSTDVIEDATLWLTKQHDLAPDGRIGIIGISFAGGLSVVAAGRESMRDKLAYVLSFGGHADLPRVMRYLATGEEVHLPGVELHPPHDYGVAVILLGIADRIVPPDQVPALRHGIETFLTASQLTLVDMNKAKATFEQSQAIAATLPEPSAHLMRYVNERNTKALGAELVPVLDRIGAEEYPPPLSAEQSPTPSAPVYLLHGTEDTVIPAVETRLLAQSLRARGATVHPLLSGLITHAEVDKSAAAAETVRLVGFWAAMLNE